VSDASFGWNYPPGVTGREPEIMGGPDPFDSACLLMESEMIPEGAEEHFDKHHAVCDRCDTRWCHEVDNVDDCPVCPVSYGMEDNDDD
jgi:hypothetical protein